MTHDSLTILKESEEAIFSLEELSTLNSQKIPRHIAIIMDGNRRWASAEELETISGHWEGAELLTDVVRASAELGVRTLTVFAFSTENWSRPQHEIEALMELFEFYLLHKREMMEREGIKFQAIGDLSRLSAKISNVIEQTRKATEHCERINLVLAINYGARDEIRRAMGKILRYREQYGLAEEDLTESFIAKFLDTSKWGDPDLLIRTGGEMRLSNFLLWQISYAELWMSNKFWPEFTPHDLLDAIKEYQLRKRRIGQ